MSTLWVKKRTFDTTHWPFVRETQVSGLEIDGNFGDEAEVDVLRGERGKRGEKAGRPSHELDHADSVRHVTGRLGLGGRDRARRLRDRRPEPERVVDDGDVVVDRLRNRRDRHVQTPLVAYKTQTRWSWATSRTDMTASQEYESQQTRARSQKAGNFRTQKGAACDIYVVQSSASLNAPRWVPSPPTT